MVAALRGDETAQLTALATLISQDDTLASAMCRGDWPQVAELRAGPGYGALGYDEALAAYATAYAAVTTSASVAYGGGDDEDADDDETKKRPKP